MSRLIFSSLVPQLGNQEHPSWIQVAQQIQMIGEGAIYLPGTPEHWDTKKTVDPPDSWKVVNVIMVEWVEGVAFRRGIGKVLVSAWERAERRDMFVYLG